MIAFLTMLTLAAADAATQKEPPAVAATVPAEALALGDKIEKLMPGRLLDWTKKRGRAALEGKFAPEELSAERIAQSFAKESAEAREVIRFMAGYQAYRRASREQEGRAAALRDLDREIRFLEDRMHLLEVTGAPIGSLAEAQLRAEQAAVQNRMENLQLRRGQAARLEQIERQRVDDCLRWLDEAHTRVKDIPPEVVRAVRAPRN